MCLVITSSFQIGDDWSGTGWYGAVYTGTTTVVTDTATVVINERTYTNCLQIHTIITGSHSFGAGTRNAWFAPDIGLVKFVYNHDDGSVTMAELQAYNPTVVFLPLVLKNYDPTDFPAYPSGETILHQKDEKIPYNYWSYVPKSLTRNETAYIFLEISHPQIEDYDALTLAAKNTCNQFIDVAESRNYIILTPVIPRDFSEGYYPQGINQYSLDPLTPNFYYRPDLKVNIIIENFKKELEEAGYSIQDKVFVSGFSAGGMWANRYSLLHPERVKAAAMGQAGGWLAMPITSYNGTDLNWPLGLNNYSLLTGESYNKYNIFKSVPMFIFIGDQDTTSTYYDSDYPDSNDITIWGNSDPVRLENQYNHLKNLGYNVSFKLYPNVGHNYNSEMRNDVIDFFEQSK